MVGYKATASESMRELKPFLEAFQKRCPDLQFVHTDSCCKDRPLLVEIFGPHLQVKLDTFHCFQRVMKTLPKRTKTKNASQGRNLMRPSEKGAFIHDLKMAIRNKEDVNFNKREMKTVAPKEIVANFTRLEDKYGTHMSRETSEEIAKLKKHAEKGCLR